MLERFLFDTSGCGEHKWVSKERCVVSTSGIMGFTAFFLISPATISPTISTLGGRLLFYADGSFEQLDHDSAVVEAKVDSL